MYNGYCWWKVHGRIWGYSKENPINQYDPAVISPMWTSVVHVAIISVKPTREWFVFDYQSNTQP
jgi:hypothetical protein